MEDMIPRGTGNSRFLKSVENFKTQYPNYDAFAAALVAGTLPIDFNGINREGILRPGTPINTLSLFQNGTAGLYGLGKDAAPDDAFAFLGKYNLHFWSVLFGTTKGYYEPVLSPTVGATLGATEDMYGMGGNFVRGYSNELEVSAGGAVDLKNIQSLSFTRVPNSLADCQTFANEILSHAPCYIKVVDIVGETSFYYIPDGATYTVESIGDAATNGTLVAYDSGDDGTGTYIYSLNVNAANNAAIPASVVTGAAYIEGDPGTIIFKHSADRNAYPDSGTVDGETYTYLGVPFEKLPMAGRVETGSYTGTGTYGESNKSSLTFSFNPQIVIIQSGEYLCVMLNGGSGVVHWRNASPTLTTTWGDRTVSWYYSSGNSADYQMNGMNVKYRYIAIG